MEKVSIKAKSENYIITGYGPVIKSDIQLNILDETDSMHLCHNHVLHCAGAYSNKVTQCVISQARLKTSDAGVYGI